jgi:hypothetical protein
MIMNSEMTSVLFPSEETDADLKALSGIIP